MKRKLELDQPVATGGTVRDQYLKVGRAPPDGWEPPLPLGLEYLVEWFGELEAARTSSGFALNPISYSEILAWAVLTERCPTPFDVRVLRDLDAVHLADALRSRAVKTGDGDGR